MESIYVRISKQLLTCLDEDESQRLFQDSKEIVGAVIILATPLSINATWMSCWIDKEATTICKSL